MHHSSAWLLFGEIHESSPVRGELLSNDGLAHVVRFHFISWAVLNSDNTLLDLIRYKEVTDVDVAGSLTDTLLAIDLQFYRALIVHCLGVPRSPSSCILASQGNSCSR